MRRSCATLSLAVLILVGAADADDPRLEPEEVAATEVAAAFERRDVSAVARAAAGRSPDPWMVAEVLCARGAHEAAAAFAAAAPDPAGDAIRRYVASQRGTRPRPRDLERVRQINAAYQEGNGWTRDVAVVVEQITGGSPAAIDTISSLRIELGRSYALHFLGRRADALAALLGVTTAAEAFGWAYRASGLRYLHGTWAWDFRRRQAAKESWTRCAALAEQAGRKTLHGQVEVMLARIALEEVDPHQAHAHVENALRLAKQAEMDGLRVWALAHRAGALVLQAEYDEALAAANDALDSARSLRLDKKTLAVALEQRAHVFRRLGEIAQALEDWDHLVTLRQETGDDRAKASALHEIGNLNADLGRHELAREYYARALAIERSQPLPWPDRLVDHQVSLAEMQVALGNPDAARAALSEAARLHESVPAADRDPQADLKIPILLGNLAIEAEVLGEAREHWSRVRELAREREDRPTEVQTLAALGWLTARGGDLEEGLEQLDDAIREARSLQAMRILLGCLDLKAVTLLQARRFREARETVLQGIGPFQRVLTGLGEEEGAAGRARHARLFETGAAAAIELGDSKSLFEMFEYGRSGSLLESLKGRETIDWGETPEELKRLEAEAKAELREAERRVAENRRLNRLDRNAHAAVLAAARKVQELNARIVRAGKAREELQYPAPKTLTRVQRALGPGDAFVLYGEVHSDLAALVVTTDAARIVRLGAAAPVFELAQQLALEDAAGDPTQAIERLHAAIVAPLALADGTEAVLVSPTGVLAYSPFSLLFPGRDVAFIPSGTTLELLERHDSRRAPGNEVLALGGVPYGTGRHERLGSLPASRAEAEAVGKALVGPDASETQLIEVLQSRDRWRALHLACHGVIDTDSPMTSYLALAPSATDDGLLTCIEVFRMRIDADMAVLSACESSKGRVYRAEGVVGFVRAFMFAGTPRVLCSLWKVEDAATGALMRRFYELWNPKASDGAEALTAAAALREAQAFVRSHENWQHPYYWAAWVLWGLPR